VCFQIPRTEGRAVNLSLAKINLELSVDDVVKTTDTDKYGEKLLVGNPFASAFQSVVVKVNNTVVSESDTHYPFISDFLYQTKINQTHRAACEKSGKVYYDYGQVKMNKKGEITFDMANFKDADERVGWYREGATLHLSTYLFVDLTTGPNAAIIGDNADILIELSFNPPERAFLAQKPEHSKPVLVVNKAEIVVPRILCTNPSVTRRTKMQYLKVRSIPVFIPADTTNYTTALTFSGRVPSRVYMRFIDGDAFDGCYKSNPFYSYHNNIQSIQMGCGGQSFPSEPYTVNWDEKDFTSLWLRCYENLRFSLEKTGMPMPSLFDYENKQFFYVMDLSRDQSTDSSWTTKTGSGALSLRLKFSKPTNKPLVAMVLFETVATLDISSNGEVSLT